MLLMQQIVFKIMTLPIIIIQLLCSLILHILITSWIPLFVSGISMIQSLLPLIATPTVLLAMELSTLNVFHVIQVFITKKIILALGPAPLENFYLSINLIQIQPSVLHHVLKDPILVVVIALVVLVTAFLALMLLPVLHIIKSKNSPLGESILLFGLFSLSLLVC